MTLNKKQSKSTNYKIECLICLFVTTNLLISYQAYSQEIYNLNELEINRTINLEEENNLDFPTNPFEIIDKIRRVNSMNEATKPSDAIDEAIKSFDMIKEEKQI